MIKALLLRPYAIDSRILIQSGKAVVFGLFVFLFLFGFQPFQLNTYAGNLLALTAGYGVVCMLIMMVLNAVVPLFFTLFFIEKKWNVGRHIFWTIVNVAFIGLANAFYSQQMGIFSFNLAGIVRLELYTIALAVFPISAGILWNENRLSHKFQASSEQINKAMAARKESAISAVPAENDRNTIYIPSENKGEGFTVEPKNVLLVKAAENYAEVFWKVENQVKKKVVRASLKRLEEVFHAHPQVFRCHKSFMVNLEQVAKLSGNAQGFKLHFKAEVEPVPVSRQLNGIIKKKLESPNL